MGENNYQTGGLFIRGDKGEFEPFSIGYTEENIGFVEDVNDKQPIVIAVDTSEASFSCTLDCAPFIDSLKRMQRALGLIMIRALCPNRRVAYLAIHAKKARDREKNYKRALELTNKFIQENKQNEKI